MPKMPRKAVITDVFDRIDGESAKQYQHFLEYCKLGPGRTLEKLSKKVGISEAYGSKMSAANNWKLRSVAYDQEQNRIFFEELKIEVREGAKDVAKLGRVLQSKAVEALKYYDIESGEGAKRIPLADVPKWAEAGVRIARLALDLSPTGTLYDTPPTIEEQEDIVALVLDVLEAFPDAKDELAKRLEMVSK